MTREQPYTALSRGRVENHVYLDDPDRRALDRHAREFTPTADQLLQSAVACSGSQQMAIDHQDDAAVRAATVEPRARLRRLDVVAAQHTNRLREIQNQRDQLQPARERWSAWYADHKHDLDRLTNLNLHIRIAEAIRDRGPEQALESPPHSASSPRAWTSCHNRENELEPGQGRMHTLLLPVSERQSRHTGRYSWTMADIGRVRDGVRLRHAICVCLLEEQRAMTVPEIVAGVEARGLSIPGRASKTVSDALRWEARKGRAIRLERSQYRTGTMPRSTEWWIRSQVAAHQKVVAQIPAKA
jgi:hypothetical protein